MKYLDQIVSVILFLLLVILVKADHHAILSAVSADTISVQPSAVAAIPTPQPSESVKVDWKEVYGGSCDADTLLYKQFKSYAIEKTTAITDSEKHNLFFKANIYAPQPEQQDEHFKQAMNQIVKATLYEAKDGETIKVGPVGRMLHLKWSVLSREFKKAHEADDLFGEWGFYLFVTPEWQWKDMGMTTYHVVDHLFTGGAHGMEYNYFMTYSDKEHRMMGLNDIFKADKLDKVFKLISQKLKTHPYAPEDEDIWTFAAEYSNEPDGEFPLVIAGACEEYRGKVYPRPALTGCGVVFNYPPYEKNAYAVGTISILLKYNEIEDCLKL